jgi:hypothetical protein
VAGWYFGSHPCANVSMISMRPPQQGQGFESVDGSLSPVLSSSSGLLGRGGLRRCRAGTVAKIR